MTEIATIDWFGRWGTFVFSENNAIFIEGWQKSGKYCYFPGMSGWWEILGKYWEFPGKTGI